VTAKVGAAILALVCMHASMAGIRVAAPLWALESGHAKAAVGLLIALFALAHILAAVPSGRFADRHGLRRSMVIGTALATPGLALPVLLPGYGTLCVAALLSGGAMALATIAVQRHVGRIATNASELRRVFSLVSLAPAAANTAGPVLAGFAIDLAGFSTAFAVMACLPVAAWVLVRRVVEPPALADTEPGKPHRAWDLLATSGMRRLLFMNALMVASWEFHAFMVPILGHERSISASGVGVVMGAFALGAVAVRSIVHRLLDRFAEYLLITVAIAVSGLVLLAYPMAVNIDAMVLFSLVLGISLGSVQPSVLSMLHTITPAGRQGEALAVRVMLGNASTLTIPLLIGAAGGFLGASAAFWLMGSLVAVGSRVGLKLRFVGITRK
jgi:MFS family permease